MVGAIDIGGIDFQVAIAKGLKGELLPVGRPGGRGVFFLRIGDAGNDFAGNIKNIDIGVVSNGGGECNLAAIWREAGSGAFVYKGVGGETNYFKSMWVTYWNPTFLTVKSLQPHKDTCPCLNGCTNTL